MAAEIDLTRLTTFQHHVDDMRNLIMCKICLKPLYEPFILACGHTYCYGCLRSWFSGLDSRRRQKNCPDCRAEVESVPAPNYILRDLVHMFISRAELLSDDETVEEHLIGIVEESDLLANDKDNRGLFLGAFSSFRRSAFGVGPIRDFEDGVDRCPRCAWEIEDGQCDHCGYEADDHFRDWSSSEDEVASAFDEQSIPSDDMSNGSGTDSEPDIPHPFYAARSLVGDVDPSIATDDHSELDYYDTSIRHGYDDEGDRFIDDYDEDDEPDEVDEDDVDDLPRGFIPYQRMGLRGQHRIPDDDEDDEESGNDRPVSLHIRRLLRQLDDDTDNGDESSVNGYAESNQDQATNYGESEESRSTTPVVIPVLPRRRPIVISDSEEDEEQEQGETDNEETLADNRSQTEDGAGEENNSPSGGSDDTTMQFNNFERQYPANTRKRTRSPDPSSWRTVARPRRDDNSDRQISQTNSRTARQMRNGRNQNNG